MPWHWEPMKDVISCDKLRGAANQDASVMMPLKTVQQRFNRFAKLNAINHMAVKFVETDENDHVLNIYANYDMQRQQVCDELEITLYGSGIDDQSLTYHLNAAEKEVLREKMEAYCMQREHMPLNQLCQEILQEQDAPTQEMQL